MSGLNPYWRARSTQKRPAGVSPEDYVTLLGSNLVAFWHASYGVQESGGSVSQWDDVVSDRAAVLNGSGTSPQYGADGSDFAGKPVVQFSASQRMLQTATSEIIPTAARPYVFCVNRFRAVGGSYPYVWALNDTDDMVQFAAPVVEGTAYLQFKQPDIVFATAGVADLAQHTDEAWLGGSLGHFVRDGVDNTVAATGVSPRAITRVRITNTAGNVSIACLGVCTTAPSAGQLTALRALLAADW